MTMESSIKAYLTIIVELGRTIKEAGKEGIPAGHLYATCMSAVSLDGFEQMIGKLVTMKMVKRVHNLLVWIGD